MNNGTFGVVAEDSFSLGRKPSGGLLELLAAFFHEDFEDRAELFLLFFQDDDVLVVFVDLFLGHGYIALGGLEGLDRPFGLVDRPVEGGHPITVGLGLLLKRELFRFGFLGLHLLCVVSGFYCCV